jgi:hypothetical protein
MDLSFRCAAKLDGTNTELLLSGSFVVLIDVFACTLFWLWLALYLEKCECITSLHLHCIETPHQYQPAFVEIICCTPTLI